MNKRRAETNSKRLTEHSSSSSKELAKFRKIEIIKQEKNSIKFTRYCFLNEKDFLLHQFDGRRSYKMKWKKSLTKEIERKKILSILHYS